MCGGMCIAMHPKVVWCNDEVCCNDKLLLSLLEPATNIPEKPAGSTLLALMFIDPEGHCCS